jgi:hypothetical protein
MDSDSNVLTFSTKTMPDKTAAWSDGVRELAFELWYTDAGRRLRTLERILETDPYNIPVPYQTLWHWHRQHQWDIEADKRLAQFVPHRRMRTAGLLVVAAEGFASYLAQVASGAIPPDKQMNAAAKIALDASGFASVRVDTPAIATRSETRDLASLSDAELARLERGR